MYEVAAWSGTTFCDADDRWSDGREPGAARSLRRGTVRRRAETVPRRPRTRRTRYREQLRALASRAFEVLHSWRTCPGIGPDAYVDLALLSGWVSAARSRLTEDARLGPGDSEIGKILAYAPADVDTMFPPRAVRDLLEDVRSDALEEGLTLGVPNKRGVTSRRLLDGGKQEWDLAAQLRVQEEAATPWPRTRKLLRMLAEQYERDARREDEESERRRRGMHD